MDKFPITPQGYQALSDELDQLKKVEMPRVSKEIGVAREHGDLRENAEYHAAKEKQGMIQGRINEIEGIIAHAEIIDPKSLSGNKVKFGATVTLEDSDSGKNITYWIVGASEADINKGKISVNSPLARALIGKTEGDEVEVIAPGGKKTYEIITVSFG